jgi:hypothetical protein
MGISSSVDKAATNGSSAFKEGRFPNETQYLGKSFVQKDDTTEDAEEKLGKSEVRDPPNLKQNNDNSEEEYDEGDN